MQNTFLDSFFTFLSRLFAPDFWSRIPDYVFSFADFLRPYSTVVSLLLLTCISYCYLRRHQLEGHGEHAGEGHETETDAASSEVSPTALRWEKINAHLHSEKESDWRLAVLEADIMLDEFITHLGYQGDSLGEKLKRIEKSDFTTLDQAWEAHAVRNKIAHEGAAFALTEREAKRVIKLYEEVFREFKYI
jgi:hypothetical protein